MGHTTEEGAVHLGIIPDGNRRWCSKHGILAGKLLDRHIGLLVRTMLGSIDLFSARPELSHVRKLSMYMLSIDNLTKRSNDASDGTMTMVSGMLEGIHWLATIVFMARAFSFPGLSRDPPPPSPSQSIHQSRDGPQTINRNSTVGILFRSLDDVDAPSSAKQKHRTRNRNGIDVTIDVEGVRPIMGPLFPTPKDMPGLDPESHHRTDGLQELRTIVEHFIVPGCLYVKVSRKLHECLSPANRRILAVIVKAVNRAREDDNSGGGGSGGAAAATGKNANTIRVTLRRKSDENENEKDNKSANPRGGADLKAGAEQTHLNQDPTIGERQQAHVIVECTNRGLVDRARRAAAIMSRWSRLRVSFVGEKYLLSPRTQCIWENVERITACDRPSLHVRFALAYDPLADMRRLLDHPDNIDPIDVVVRTSGEQRSSGFFPVETMYSEWVYIQKLFPDVTALDIADVLREYRSRNRRHGA